MIESLSDFYELTSIIDLFYLIITILSLIKCYKKGFVLSVLSMAKWLLAYIITLIIFPRIKPYLKDVIDNEYFLDVSLGVAHNGNLTNSIFLRNKLVEEGAIFYTTSDTETIVQLIAKSKRPKTIDKVIDAIFQIQGGYALVMLTQKSLIGVRDPFGIRPLIIGKLKDSFIFASETCALDIVGATYIREIEFVKFPL